MLTEVLDKTVDIVSELTNGIQTAPQPDLVNGVENAAMLQMSATPGMQMNPEMLPAANGPAQTMELADMPYHAQALQDQALDNVMKPAGPLGS